MADTRPVLDEPAHVLVRPRRPAGRRGHDDEGPVPVTRLVRVYHAADCSLCERALEVVREARATIDFDLEVVDIGGEPDLEALYREHLPVVEIDGERAFTYFVPRDALLARLAR